MKNIIIAQLGARHRYEIAKILHKKSLLKALYTDSSNFTFFGRLARLFKRFHPTIKRLSNREIHDIPKTLIKSTDKLFLVNLFRSKTSFKRQNLANHKVFSKTAIKWGVKGADALYHMYIENLDFVRHAKSKNLKIITDVYISPLTEDIMIKEHQNHPYLKNINYDLDDIKIYKEKIEEAINLSDVLLCPSNWVAKGVLEINPKVKDKIKIVPYGSSISFSDVSNDPVVGRFLFVGYDVSRKGLVYLGKAASILKNMNYNIDVRIAGLSREGELNHEVFRDLNFLGKLEFHQLKEEYTLADSFVLPSFSEGLAGVLVEAMSAGLPIISTLNAGIDFSHKENAYVITPGNDKEIVEAMLSIIDNRVLREHLAMNSKKLADYYSIASWGERLEKVLKDI